MSTMTMSLSSRPRTISSAPKLASAAPSALVAAAEVGVADRVLVIGRNVIEQVVALVQAGCRTVLSLRADSACPRGETADVLWLSGLDDMTDRLAASLRGGAIPRVVVIEVGGADADVRLRPAYRQLRAKGFVRFSSHRTITGIALVAARPVWLQRVH